MSDRRKQLLYECYLTGQMSEAQWNEHLAEDAGLREYVGAHAPFAEPEPMRDKACAGYMAQRAGSAEVRAAFYAGWNARKQAEYKHALLPARDRWRDKL
jgi:hypothetical protein